MAGSYSHCIDKNGRLLDAEKLSDMLENGGDVYEAIEEMFGMIWWLAQGNAVNILLAHDNYKQGLRLALNATRFQELPNN